MTEQQLQDEMVWTGASLFSHDCATGSAGSLSLLLPDGSLLVTLTGSYLGELQAQRLSVVTLQSERLSGDKPSKEATSCRTVYLHNPVYKTIVHLHSHYLTALSCLQRLDPHNCIRPFTPYMMMCVGDAPVIPYCRPGDDCIAQALTGLAPRYNTFLLVNHDPVVINLSLREATNDTEGLEETARLIFAFGNREIRYLTTDEADELR